MSEDSNPDISLSQLIDENEGVIKCNLIGGSIYNKICRDFRNSYVEIHDHLLRRIANDYNQLDYNELRDRYPLEVTVSKRKPRDPTKCCTAFTKKGDPCSFPRRDGSDYCGIHIKKMAKQNNEQTNPGRTYQAKNESGGADVTNVGVRQGTYQAKREDELPPSGRRSISRESTEEAAISMEDLAAERAALELDYEATVMGNQEASTEEEVSIQTFNDIEYVICQNILYHRPDGNLEELCLEDLKKAGHFNENNEPVFD